MANEKDFKSLIKELNTFPQDKCYFCENSIKDYEYFANISFSSDEWVGYNKRIRRNVPYVIPRCKQCFEIHKIKYDLEHVPYMNTGLTSMCCGILLLFLFLVLNFSMNTFSIEFLFFSILVSGFFFLVGILSLKKFKKGSKLISEPLNVLLKERPNHKSYREIKKHPFVKLASKKYWIGTSSGFPYRRSPKNNPNRIIKPKGYL